MFKKRLERIKQQTARELLSALYQAPDHHLSAEALGEITQLRSVAYPHLARLQSEGLVEPKWGSSQGQPKLGYMLTEKGRSYIVSELNSSSAPPRNSSSSFKPIVARLSAWFG